jgi:hypothetical protein
MGPVINRELRHLHQPTLGVTRVRDLNVIPAQPFHQAAASTKRDARCESVPSAHRRQGFSLQLRHPWECPRPIASSRLIRQIAQLYADGVHGVSQALDEEQLSLTTNSSYDDIMYMFGRIDPNML